MCSHGCCYLCSRVSGCSSNSHSHFVNYRPYTSISSFDSYSFLKVLATIYCTVDKNISSEIHIDLRFSSYRGPNRQRLNRGLLWNLLRTLASVYGSRQCWCASEPTHAVATAVEAMLSTAWEVFGCFESSFPIFLAYFPYLKKYKEAYEITLLSVCLCIPLPNFFKRLMRSPCCLCFCASPLIFVRRLIRSSCCLCLCAPPPNFY
jgi:hypothetical protein